MLAVSGVWEEYGRVMFIYNSYHNFQRRSIIIPRRATIVPRRATIVPRLDYWENFREAGSRAKILPIVQHRDYCGDAEELLGPAEG